MKTPEIREFNTTDWVLLAGAEPFVGGHAPLVVDNFPYLDMTMAADRSGISVFIEDKSYCLAATNPDLSTYELMSEVFEAIVDAMFLANETELECYLSGFGFKKIY